MRPKGREYTVMTTTSTSCQRAQKRRTAFLRLDLPELAAMCLFQRKSASMKSRSDSMQSIECSSLSKSPIALSPSGLRRQFRFRNNNHRRCSDEPGNQFLLERVQNFYVSTAIVLTSQDRRILIAFYSLCSYFNGKNKQAFNSLQTL